MSLPLDSPHKKLLTEVSGLLHAERLFEAANAFLKWAGIPEAVETKKKANEVLLQYLHWLLNDGHADEAARLLWSPTMFTPEPDCTQRIWRAFDQENFILLQGSASSSKSFSMGVRLMLEWVRDPENTTVQVLGPSEQHLESNLFSHLVTLHRQSALPLPGLIRKLFIGLDTKQKKGSIRGVVVPLGRTGAGRIQGTKRVPRKKPHPRFGTLSRMFIFLDEMCNIPRGIWKDIDNILSNEMGDGGLKVIGAYNPTNQQDEVGQRAEPTFGWANFDLDKHFEWKSTRGWYVVRLDALYSENVQSGIVKYPGLQTKAGYDAIIKNAGGVDSPGYYSMCRGCFPPTGVSMAIIPGGMLNKLKAEFVWLDDPIDCAGVDLALQGTDSAIFAKGKFGMASGVRLPPSLEFPAGNIEFFKTDTGRALPRPALQLESLFLFPKGDTITMADAIIKICKQTRVKPEWLCLDRTGNGQGVYDVVRNMWGPGCLGINYSQAATKTKIMSEDSQTPEDLYDRIQTELWFALRAWIEFDAIKCLFSLDTLELYKQVGNRWFRANGRVSKIETKREYESRNNCGSPDHADAVTLLVHVVRVTGGVILGMTPENTSSKETENDDDDAGEHRVDASNRFQDIED